MSDDYKSRARKRAAERNDSSWYKVKEGDNTFRVLKTPKSKTTPEVFYEYNIHRNVGPKRKKVRCGKNLDGEGTCWLCDVQIPKLSKIGKETRAAALQSTDEMIIQVAPVDKEGKMTGPKIMTPSRGVATQIIATVLGSKRDYVDHEKGFNVSLSRTGTGMHDTRYGVLDRDDEPSAVPENVIAKLLPFSKLKEVPVYSESAQKAAYFGREEDAEEDDDDDDDDVDKTEEDDDEEEDTPAPAKKKAAVKGKAKAKPEPEEEDDDEEEDETEDDEEEEPPAKPVGKKGKKTPEPEPEEEEDEEEAEVKAPAKKKAAAKKSKAKAEPEDDDEDLDDVGDDEDEPDEVDEEEEEAPKPAAKKGSKKQPEPEDDDEEEDETEDDDEEEEPPAKKTSGFAKRKRK